MSIVKAELKKLILNDVGAHIEEMAESAAKESQAMAGGKTALRQVANKILSLQSVADQDLEDGKIADLEHLKVVKLYIDRAYQTALGAAQHLENREIAASGAVNFGSSVVKFVKKLFDQEDDKSTRLKEALSGESTDGRRAPGQHPGPSLAQIRKAEDAKSSGVQKTSEKGEEKPQPKKKASRKKKVDAKNSG